MRVHQLVDNGLGGGVGEQIVVLGGIIDHVEQLAGLARVLVDHEPVTLGLEHREAQFSLTESARRHCSRPAAIDVAAKRSTLAGIESRRTRRVAHRRRNVDVLDELVDDALGSQPRGGRMISGTRTACS